MYTAHTSDPLTILITQYTIPHNHPYIRRYLRLAATYVGMVMWDDVGYEVISLLVCALCLPLPSLYGSDFYDIFLLLSCVFLL